MKAHLFLETDMAEPLTLPVAGGEQHDLAGDPAGEYPIGGAGGGRSPSGAWNSIAWLVY